MYSNNHYVPNDPSAAGRISIDSDFNLPQSLTMYNGIPSGSNEGGNFGVMANPPSQYVNNPSQYNIGFNVNQHPRDLSIPTKMSDELPYERDVEKYKNVIRRKRYVISSLHKTQGNHYDFSINTQENLKDIRYIRLIKGTVNYTVPATAILNSYVYFPDFTNAEFVSNNKEYHGFIPVIQGAVGLNVLFSYVFSEDYLTEFKNLDTLKNKLRVQVYKENSTTGDLEFFTELNSFSIEIEYGFIDQAYKSEQQIKR